MAFWRLYYHLVWATYKREPLLDKTREAQVFNAIQSKANELGVPIHALGYVEDHIHVVAAIPPRIAAAECLRQLKGASSHYLNPSPSADSIFAWQDGYGALSFGESALSAVIEHAKNQREHHLQNTTWPTMERVSEEDGAISR